MENQEYDTWYENFMGDVSTGAWVPSSRRAPAVQAPPGLSAGVSGGGAGADMESHTPLGSPSEVFGGLVEAGNNVSQVGGLGEQVPPDATGHGPTTAAERILQALGQGLPQPRNTEDQADAARGERADDDDGQVPVGSGTEQ